MGAYSYLCVYVFAAGIALSLSVSASSTTEVFSKKTKDPSTVEAKFDFLLQLFNDTLSLEDDPQVVELHQILNKNATLDVFISRLTETGSTLSKLERKGRLYTTLAPAQIKFLLGMARRDIKDNINILNQYVVRFEKWWDKQPEFVSLKSSNTVVLSYTEMISVVGELGSDTFPWLMLWWYIRRNNLWAMSAEAVRVATKVTQSCLESEETYGSFQQKFSVWLVAQESHMTSEWLKIADDLLLRFLKWTKTQGL